MPIRLSQGSAAANIYKIIEHDNVISHLLLDWSYDSIDFKYMNNKWITINKDNINSLKSEEYDDFKELSDFCFNNMNNFSENADKTLVKLNEIIDSKKF
jgi:hypothetical protein